MANINASTTIITRSSAFDKRTTFLVEAAKGGHLEIVKYLLEKGGNINDKDDKCRTALIYASSGGCLEIIKYLIEKGADVNIKNNNGETALDFAKKELQSIQHMRMQQPSFLTVNIIEENGNKIIKVLKKKMVDVATEYENTEYEIIKILKEIRALKE